MKYFTRKNRETILKNPWYKIHRDQITTNQSSKNLTYYVIDFEEESVGAVITNDHHEILFVQAIRYITNELSLEIPAGGVEKGEDIFPTDNAIRVRDGLDTKLATALNYRD